LFIPPTAATGAKDTVYVQGDGWFDLPRSDSLWHSFLGPAAVLKAGDWIDRPSVGIPYLYVATGLELAEALKDRGNNQRASAVFNTAKNVAVAVRLDDLVKGAEATFQAPTGDTARGATLPASGAPAIAPPAATPNAPGPKTAPPKTPPKKAPEKK
jgi:hypothetical protein